MIGVLERILGHEGSSGYALATREGRGVTAPAPSASKGTDTPVDLSGKEPTAKWNTTPNPQL